MKIPAIYEVGDYFFVWKPNNIPTTFWKNKSFIEELVWLSKIVKKDLLDRVQEKFFSLVEKLGYNIDSFLLNRLDNDTGWLLYFAKSKEAFDKFKDLQSKEKIEKIYLCDVWLKRPKNILNKLENRLKRKDNYFLIDYPIAHHKFVKEKMVVIKTEKDKNKVRWKFHYVKTLLRPLYIDNNIVTFEVVIFKGIRHQIRAHLSSIWLSILWDKLYWVKLENQNSDDILHLRSIGLRFND